MFGHVLIIIKRYKCTHNRETIKKNAVTVTLNVQLYRVLGVTPVSAVDQGTGKRIRLRRYLLQVFFLSLKCF